MRQWKAIRPTTVTGVSPGKCPAKGGTQVTITGSGFGAGATGVLQSALGNLPELFICIFSLKAGLVDVVRAALVGSILANLLLVLGLAFVVGGIVVWIIGDSPIETYKLLIGSAFSWPNGIGYTLFNATPLIFTGLAVAVAFRCGLLNIGAEGQLYVAAFAAAWAISAVGRPCTSAV
jgi:hypothetical protein